MACEDSGVLMWHLRKGNKFGAKRSSYNGIQYHSKLEAQYATDLDMLKKAGQIKDWERQVKISLDVNGYHIANYYIDFIVYHTNGTTEYVEVKGFPTEVWRLKWKLFEALYSDKPDVKLTVQQ